MKPIVYLAAFQHGEVSRSRRSYPMSRSVCRTGGATKMDFELRRSLQGPYPNPAGARRIEKCGRDLDCRTGGDRQRPATAHSLGVLTRLQPYATTALGASEVSLLELATAYRTIASGIVAQPYVIRQIVRGPEDVIPGGQQAQVPVALDHGALALIQEGLRGVVRIPTGTAHALDSSAFPIAVMGKTGTTNEFKDALFVGSTYGPMASLSRFELASTTIIHSA